MKKKIIYTLSFALVLNTGCYTLSPMKYSSPDLIDPSESIKIVMKDSTRHSLNGGEYKIENDTIWYMEKFDLSNHNISLVKVPKDSIAYFNKEEFSSGNTYGLIGVGAAILAISLYYYLIQQSWSPFEE